MTFVLERIRPAVSLRIAVLLAAALLTSCARHGEKAPEAAATPAQPPAVKVTVEPVTFRQVQRYVGLVGTLHGFEEMTLGAKVGGRVKRIMHDVSDRILPNYVLLEIDPTDYQLSVRQAQKALQVELAKLGLADVNSTRTDLTHIPTVVQAQLRRENTHTRLERAKMLTAKKAMSEEDLTERMSEFRVAQAEYDNQLLLARAGVAAVQVKQEALAIAEQQLKDTVVRVPAPSHPLPGDDKGGCYAITSRTVSEGTYVMEGAELFKLVIDQSLKFRGRVPERKSGEVALGQKAAVFISAYEQPFPGEVVRINPAIDPQTRAFEVEILVPNQEGSLKPGGFAKTAILTALDEQAATVPLEALVYFAGVTKIFLMIDGKAKELQVTLGTQDTQWVEIATPTLPQGAQVVTSGQTAIADGTAISLRVVAGAKPAAPISEGTAPSGSALPDSIGPDSTGAAAPMARKESPQ